MVARLYYWNPLFVVFVIYGNDGGYFMKYGLGDEGGFMIECIGVGYQVDWIMIMIKG